MGPLLSVTLVLCVSVIVMRIVVLLALGLQVIVAIGQELSPVPGEITPVAVTQVGTILREAAYAVDKDLSTYSIVDAVNGEVNYHWRRGGEGDV